MQANFHKCISLLSPATFRNVEARRQFSQERRTNRFDRKAARKVLVILKIHNYLD